MSLEEALDWAWRQVASGRHCLFEHPWTGTSWSHPSLGTLSVRLEVKRVQ